MANSKYTHAIEILTRSRTLFSNQDPTEENPVSPYELKILSEALSYYEKYFNAFFPNKDLDYTITDVYSFRKNASLSEDIDPLIAKLKEANSAEEEGSETVEKEEDTSTLPADLEGLVEQYQEAKLKEQLFLDNSADSVAEAVKRARATWLERNRIKTILANRDENQREKDQDASDKFFVENVDAKKGDKRIILANSEKLIRQVIEVQANNLGLNLTESQKKQAIDDIVYLGLAGTIDITNANSLNIISQVAIHNTGAFFDSPIIEINNATQVVEKSLEEKPYSNSPEEETQKLRNLIQKEKDKIEKEIAIQAEKLESDLKKQNLDFSSDLSDIQKFFQGVHEKLSAAIPDPAKPFPKVTPLETHGTELESAIRQSDPGHNLSMIPVGLGTKAAAALETGGGRTRESSPEAINLFSIGITPDKFAEVEKFAKDNPNSPLGKLYRDQPDVFDQVRFQIGKLGDLNKNMLGREIASAEVNNDTPLGKLYRDQPDIKSQLPQDMANGFNVGSKITAKITDSKLGKKLSVKFKPFSDFSKNATANFNKNFGKFSTIAKFAQNPAGFISNWVSKKAGQRIGAQLISSAGNSAIRQELGRHLAKNGLEAGVKAFSKEALEKLVVKAASWAALKLGISLSAESLNAIAPGLGLVVDLAIQAALFIIEKTVGAAYSAFQGLAKSIYGEEIKARDVAAAGAVVAGGVVATGVTFFAGLKILRAATVAAAISAFTIIMITLGIIGLYTAMVFFVSPILSTFVQLDSVEKVVYPPPTGSASGDCVWPTTGHYMIQTGPNGGTHRLSKLEGIDISAPDGSPFLAVAPGTVAFTGPWGNYGNTVKIQSDTTAGSTVILYAHLSQIGVSVGEKVSAGAPVGLVGGSGGWSPHIHFHYENIKYNSCPAGGLIVPDTCCNYCGDGSPLCVGAGGGFLYSN